ncbi:hypothetical protein JW921_04130, partial [Candidatus Fermentibacterales bacterium]|nr:hypothetical protein [Candidatus Fermentibacterales bacterium]
MLGPLARGAAPVVPGACPEWGGSPSTGISIWDPGSSGGLASLGTVEVCVLRVEFLEDFTTQTTGDGRFDLESSPPHDKDYIEGIWETVSGYFGDVSGGQMELRYTVFPEQQTAAYGLLHQMSWYGGRDDWLEGSCMLLRDAVEAADPEVDFSLFDVVVVVHAGAGREADILRDSPHDLSSVFLTLQELLSYLPGLDPYGIATDDGVYVQAGCIVPEEETQDGFGLGVIGVTVYELCRQLGLPALWNTLDGGVGIGAWGIMGYGQWVMDGFWPPAPCAYCRARLGWIAPQTASEDGTWPVILDGTVLRIDLSGSEYFLVENRVRDPDADGLPGEHEHDFGLPGSGVLVWHVDQGVIESREPFGDVNGNPDHKGVDLEEADGIQDFDYSLPDVYGIYGSEYDPYFQGGYAWLLGPDTEPSSATSWGGNTFLTLEILDQPADTMDVSLSRTGNLDGWPIRTGSKASGVLCADFDGNALPDHLIWLDPLGIIWIYGTDGSFLKAIPAG